jgi:hypothetical protein
MVIKASYERDLLLKTISIWSDSCNHKWRWWIFYLQQSMFGRLGYKELNWNLAVTDGD